MTFCATITRTQAYFNNFRVVLIGGAVASAAAQDMTSTASDLLAATCYTDQTENTGTEQPDGGGNGNCWN